MATLATESAHQLICRGRRCTIGADQQDVTDTSVTVVPASRFVIAGLVSKTFWPIWAKGQTAPRLTVSIQPKTTNHQTANGQHGLSRKATEKTPFTLFYSEPQSMRPKPRADLMSPPMHFTVSPENWVTLRQPLTKCHEMSRACDTATIMAARRRSFML